jgi:hypothetical protein
MGGVPVPQRVLYCIEVPEVPDKLAGDLEGQWFYVWSTSGLLQAKCHCEAIGGAGGH